jgi:LmbE family N-acetylglucosaminyl deacetylase
MALHADKRQIYCIFATDGAKSPSPLLPWQGSPAPNLPQIRRAEASSALGEIGVPAENLEFLDLDDGRLGSARNALEKSIAEYLTRIRPDFMLVPFRFDRHPDHVALNRAAIAVVREYDMETRVLEYFVYTHWRLIPGRDIRRMVTESRMLSVDISPVADQKRKALSHYRSQNSVMYAWQDTPIVARYAHTDGGKPSEKMCRAGVFSAFRIRRRTSRLLSGEATSIALCPLRRENRQASERPAGGIGSDAEPLESWLN